MPLRPNAGGTTFQTVRLIKTLSASFEWERGSPTRSNVKASRSLDHVGRIEVGYRLRLTEPRSEPEQNFDGECRWEYMAGRKTRGFETRRLAVRPVEVLTTLVAIANSEP